MFYISISNGLLSGGHRKRMGASVWEFMWCIDRITKVDSKGLGWVLGGKPIQLKELSESMEVDEDTISANLTKLEKEGYIKKTRTPYGIVIKVMRAKKTFGRATKPEEATESPIVKEEKKPEPEPEIELPPWLNQKAWAYWIQFRKELKKKMTPMTIKMQIKFLGEHQTDHVAIIKRSIMNGWQGLFPLPTFKGQGTNQGDKARAYEKHIAEDTENRMMAESVKNNDALRKIAEDAKKLLSNMQIH